MNVIPSEVGGGTEIAERRRRKYMDSSTLACGVEASQWGGGTTTRKLWSQGAGHPAPSTLLVVNQLVRPLCPLVSAAAACFHLLSFTNRLVLSWYLVVCILLPFDTRFPWADFPDQLWQHVSEVLFISSIHFQAWILYVLLWPIPSLLIVSLCCDSHSRCNQYIYQQWPKWVNRGR